MKILIKHFAERDKQICSIKGKITTNQLKCELSTSKRSNKTSKSCSSARDRNMSTVSIPKSAKHMIPMFTTEEVGLGKIIMSTGATLHLRIKLSDFQYPT